MTDKNKLRIYFGPQDSRSFLVSEVDGSAGSVEVPLQDLLEALGDAVRKKCAWVEDFRDEKVMVSTDLYEVIAAYQQLRHSA